MVDATSAITALSLSWSAIAGAGSGRTAEPCFEPIADRRKEPAGPPHGHCAGEQFGVVERRANLRGRDRPRLGAGNHLHWRGRAFAGS